MTTRKGLAVSWIVAGVLAFAIASSASIAGLLLSGSQYDVIRMIDGWPLLIVYLLSMLVFWASHSWIGGRYWLWGFAIAAMTVALSVYWAYTLHANLESMRARGFSVDGLGRAVAIGAVFQLNAILGAAALHFGFLAIKTSDRPISLRHWVGIAILSAAPVFWLVSAVLGFAPIRSLV